MSRAVVLCLVLAGCATKGPTCPEPAVVVERLPVPAPERPKVDQALIADCRKPVPPVRSARAYKLAYDAAVKSIDECNARLARARKGQ